MLTTYITRFFTLSAALGGLVFLGYYLYVHMPYPEPSIVLGITLPDMLFFYLAYKTYPATDDVPRRRHVRS